MESAVKSSAKRQFKATRRTSPPGDIKEPYRNWITTLRSSRDISVIFRECCLKFSSTVGGQPVAVRKKTREIVSSKMSFVILKKSLFFDDSEFIVKLPGFNPFQQVIDAVK